MIQLTKGLGSNKISNSSYGSFLATGLFDLDYDLFNFDMSVPDSNINEDDHAYSLVFSVPGMEKEDLEIDIDNGILTISGSNGKIKEKHFSFGSLSRSFMLPDNIDEDRIHAKCNNNTLQLTIPKKEPLVPKPKKEIFIS